MTSRLSTIGSCGRRGGGHARDSEAERERESSVTVSLYRVTCHMYRTTRGWRLVNSAFDSVHARLPFSPRACQLASAKYDEPFSTNLCLTTNFNERIIEATKSARKNWNCREDAYWIDSISQGGCVVQLDIGSTREDGCKFFEEFSKVSRAFFVINPRER